MNPSSINRLLRCASILLFFVVARQQALPADTNLDFPAPASIKINYDRDIRPILEQSCLRCHGGPKPRSHFRLNDREAALAGGDDNTNDIVPGDSRHSQLIAYVARKVPDLEMPPIGRGDPLTRQQISLLRAWIDQGPVWTTTNQPPPFSFTFSPTLRQIVVQGNQAKFRELQGVPAGTAWGVQEFSAVQPISPDERVSLKGHAIAPDQDFALQWALDKDDVGFIHAGLDQWRKYYATDAGYGPAIFPTGYNLDQDLHVDNGRAWVDFGLDLPRWPQIVLGYEYRYRTGNESTLDWGGNVSGKNTYPSTQLLDERTHTIKLDVSKDIADWHVQDNSRVSFYTENNQGSESSFVVSHTTPDEFVKTGDNYRQVQGMNTLVIEKQVRDWWFVNGGFYYSYLSGSDYFNQSTAILPPINFNSALNSQQITLSRHSEIFSVANLFTPTDGLTFSLGSQNEWTGENGFGESIPDLEVGGTDLANSSLDEFKASQTANVRFTRIPFSVLFGDAQFSEDKYSIYQAENNTIITNALQRETAANALRYDLKTGFSTSPWSWGDWTTQFERRSSDTDYNQLTDQWQYMPLPTNGYPGFILNREIISDGVESRLVLRPTRWLKTTLSCQFNVTDYSSKTEQNFVSPGGFIGDGYSDSQTYGLGATVTPWRQLYFSGAFTYSRSRTVTSEDNGATNLVPYIGDVVTFNASATYALNAKTSLQLAYNASRANYSQNNGLDSIPTGLDYLRQDVEIGISRKLTKNWTGVLRYEYSQYNDPGGGNLYNFTANAIFASLVFRWP